MTWPGYGPRREIVCEYVYHSRHRYIVREWQRRTLQRADDSGGVAAADQVDSKVTKGAGNQWKYDVLDARVLSTMKAIGMARLWLPRLVGVAQAAREDEKRRAARIGSRKKGSQRSVVRIAFQRRRTVLM